MKEFEGKNLILHDGRKRDTVLESFEGLLERRKRRHSFKKLDCPVREKGELKLDCPVREKEELKLNCPVCEKEELKLGCPACGEEEGCRRAPPP